MAPMLFVPVAELVHETGEIITFNLSGFCQDGVLVSKDWSMLLFGILICALNLIIILMYKNRVLQLRLCIYNILFLIGLSGIMLFVVYNVQNIESISFRLPAVFPVISAILHYLAFRGIRRDEMMVLALRTLR
jgi:hypothetical protein